MVVSCNRKTDHKQLALLDNIIISCPEFNVQLNSRNEGKSQEARNQNKLKIREQ